jgi:RyR domain/ATPase family associated with various cellular activities (AAA)
MPPTTASRHLVVAGDVSIDWLAWPLPAERETGSAAANWRQHEGTRMVARRGGALLLVDLLRQATKRPVVGPYLDGIELKSPDEHLHSLVDLEPKPKEKDKAQTFRVSRLRGFCGPDGRHPTPPPLDGSAAGAGLLVLDDPGNGFRDTRSAWQTLLAEARPDWLIVKMACALAAGPMWEAVRQSPLGAHGTPDPERLIVVLNADDLRAEGIALSRRLSWERTAEDFVRELGSNGRLDTLATCAHLIVRFDCDGVIHHHGRSAEPPVLYFDPAHTESEFVDAQGGRMMGMTAAFTAGLAAALAEDPGHGLDAGIRRGMTASRRLAAAGFREDEKHAPDYPCAHAVTGAPDLAIVALSIPSKRIAAGKTWSILHDTLGDPGNAARRVVTEGPAAALTRVPVARFSKLQTADRREIESFRAIGNLLREYLSAPRTKPISIGVFGPPGAGKSFGVTEVAAQVAKDRKLTLIEFNLSQFTSLGDLVAAFHLVRDSALSGSMPLVFFDEFDSAFGGELGWLRYFLAPMQDGKFREGGHAHPLGAAIFVFAGGTRPSFNHFAAPMSLPEDDDERLAFAAAKGPDFASRLRGHVDILGPDPADKDDRTYPIRRGFLLRSLIERDARQLISGTQLRIDEGVLNALLTVLAYRHGVRSMEAVLAMSALTNRTQFERAALPPADQLGLQVDAAAFMARVTGERLDDNLREQLGRLLHEVYRKQRLSIVENEEERAQLSGDKAMADWSELGEIFRESSRLQADDIPRKLRLINCFTAIDTEGRVAVEKFKPEEIAKLAEPEHERFNAERLRQQWQLGERDPSKRKNPFLVPWRDLPEKWRSLDEAAVAAIPSALAAVRWHVYRVG